MNKDEDQVVSFGLVTKKKNEKIVFFFYESIKTDIQNVAIRTHVVNCLLVTVPLDP